MVSIDAPVKTHFTTIWFQRPREKIERIGILARDRLEYRPDRRAHALARPVVELFGRREDRKALR